MTRFLLVLLVSALVAGTGSAADSTDTGKRKILRLFQDSIAAVAESTVRIQANGNDAILGTIVSKDGYILTKGSELRGTLTCKLRDGSAYDVDYVGYHRESDLALLKIDVDQDLVPVKFAPGKQAEPGNWVAIPGVGTDALAVGVISTQPRKLAPPESFIENQNKGYLGINFADNGENSKGVRIGGLQPKMAADRAGIRKDDIIIEAAGVPVKNQKSMLEIMDNYKPGDVISIKVLRNVKDEVQELTFKVTLSPRSELSRGDLQNSFGGALSGRRTGFPQVIQHDTIVDPKNCGGPLVDLDGRVVGLNIARAGRVETWALPAEVITPVLKELKEGKYPAPGKPK